MHREGLLHEINAYLNEQAVSKPSQVSAAAFFLVDIDRFSDINRALGLRDADQVLAACARWLEGHVRGVDRLARFDGARFAIWMPDASQRFEVVQLAQRLIGLTEVVIKDRQNQTRTIELSLSVSCAISPDHGQTLDELINAAMRGLQLAKLTGGGRVQLASTELKASGSSPNAWALQNDVSAAIDNNELELYYQPVYRISDKRMVGAEALLRPRIELLSGASTESMMMVVEQLPVIEELTRWGLLAACKTSATINRMVPPDRPVAIAVNLPPVVMQHPNLAAWVKDALTEAQIPAHWITLELTERGVANGESLLVHTMQDLNQMGCGLAMDDFGVGYTALAQWIRLPIKKVKFDRSLLPIAPDSKRAIALLKHLIALAKELNLVTIAEGVEYEWQWKLLKELGCDQAQGYWLSKPLAAQALFNLLQLENQEPA